MGLKGGISDLREIQRVPGGMRKLQALSGSLRGFQGMYQWLPGSFKGLLGRFKGLSGST